jgi:hypothetical protein
MTGAGRIQPQDSIIAAIFLPESDGTNGSILARCRTDHDGAQAEDGKLQQ